MLDVHPSVKSIITPNITCVKYDFKLESKLILMLVEGQMQVRRRQVANNQSSVPITHQSRHPQLSRPTPSHTMVYNCTVEGSATATTTTSAAADCCACPTAATTCPPATPSNDTSSSSKRASQRGHCCAAATQASPIPAAAQNTSCSGELGDSGETDGPPKGRLPAAAATAATVAALCVPSHS